MQPDIHDYPKKLEQLKERIRQSSLSSSNIQLILDFERAMQLLENLSIPRRLSLLIRLKVIARDHFKKDFRSVTKDDIKDCLSKVQAMNYSPWTVASFKVAIKRFFKWLAYGDRIVEIDKKKYPEMVSWIRVHVSKKDRPKVKASDILTEEEAHKLIEVARLPRDRAFISMIYELGCRIGEIGNLEVGHVTRAKHGYLADLNGKTGHRTPLIVMSDPYITEWLNHHPLRDDPHAPLWITSNAAGQYHKMSYDTLRALIKRLKKRAGIKRRLYPHLFRHSRVTHLLRKGLLNEAQAKIYFGWVPESSMLNEYAHLVDQDANDQILQIYGFEKKQQKAESDIRICPRCSHINAPNSRFCVQCSCPLREDQAFHDREAQIQGVLTTLLQHEGVKRILLKELLKMEPDILKQML